MESLPGASQGTRTRPPACGHEPSACAASHSNSLRNTGKVWGRKHRPRFRAFSWVSHLATCGEYGGAFPVTSRKNRKGQLGKTECSRVVHRLACLFFPCSGKLERPPHKYVSNLIKKQRTLWMSTGIFCSFTY